VKRKTKKTTVTLSGDSLERLNEIVRLTGVSMNGVINVLLALSIVTDNRIENLEIVSIQENLHHARIAGLSKYAKGSASGNSKINESTVREIKKLRTDRMTYADISKKLKVSMKIVGDVCRGRTWKHI